MLMSKNFRNNKKKTEIADNKIYEKLYNQKYYLPLSESVNTHRISMLNHKVKKFFAKVL